MKVYNMQIILKMGTERGILKYIQKSIITVIFNLSISPIFLHIIIPISIGLFIYMFYRGIPIIDPTGVFFPIFNNNLPEWLLYNLPDGLWLYSLLFCISHIWLYDNSVYHFSWLLLTVTLCFTLEFFQQWEIIQGTFDWNDIISYIIVTSLHALHIFAKKYFKLRK